MILCSILVPITQIVFVPIVIGLQFIGLVDLSLSIQGFVGDFFTNTLGCGPG